jgi:Rha family phage regulatory protein
MRDIAVLKQQAAEIDPLFSQSNFGLAEYLDAQGKPRPYYMLTKDGFTSLAMGFVGTKVLQFKLAYIAQFNAMEESLRNARDTDKVAWYRGN